MRRIKTLGVAGALVGSALIGGTLISSALAAPTTSSTSTVIANLGVSDAYLDTYLDTLASELGVDRAGLGPAALKAAEAAIDAAVSAGDIDADRAAGLKAKLEALDDPASILAGRGMFGGHGPGGPGGHGFGTGDALDAAATALGIDANNLVDQMRGGSSLSEIASTQKVDYAVVVSAVTDAVTTDLDAAVADGRITQDQADERLAALQTWLDDGGQPVEAGGFGHGFGGHGPRDDSDEATDSTT